MSDVGADRAPVAARTRPTTDRGLLRFIRRRPLSAFFLWFFTVGQALAFTPVIAVANGVDMPRQPFIIASTLVGLLLPALVITRVVDGPRALHDLLKRAIDMRVSIGWYLLATLGIIFTAVLIAFVLLGRPDDLSTGTVVSALMSGLLLALVLNLLPNNLWEEVAWMGFVQARLQVRHGAALAALISAPLFALQHVSLVAGESLVNGAVVITLLAVLAIPFRFLTGWLYNRTGSLFVVGLLHATGNAVAGGSGFQGGFLARLYPGEQVATLAHLLAFFLIGSTVVIATRGRLGQRQTDGLVARRVASA